MSKFTYKIAQFMQGRYGTDKLNTALLVLYIVLIVVNLFVRTPIISVLLLLAFAYSIFRMFSKNIAKRRAENAAFLKVWSKVSGFFLRTFHRFRDIKTHRYRKCPSCKKFLRLPRKKGTHTVACPCCKNKFSVTIRL